jgi:hypothetical protein
MKAAKTTLIARERTIESLGSIATMSPPGARETIVDYGGTKFRFPRHPAGASAERRTS